jgi:hypothetical protein
MKAAKGLSPLNSATLWCSTLVAIVTYVEDEVTYTCIGRDVGPIYLLLYELKLNSPSCQKGCV